MKRMRKQQDSTSGNEKHLIIKPSSFFCLSSRNLPDATLFNVIEVSAYLPYQQICIHF